MNSNHCDNCGHENSEGARFCAECGATFTEVSTPTLVGEVVGGRYHIVDRIGEGGMGVVYLAEQTLGSAKRKVAVKTLHAELSRDPSITARFHREVGTVAQLEHPNTVRVYDFGSTPDGTLYIAMEFLDGMSLSQVIERDGALGPDRTCRVIRQVAGSLDEAHRQGVIHRDLKPENVLLIERAGEKDVVKLVDFGIAARTESADREREQKLTQQGMVLGTPPYMSPEQFTGKALDARSDVYSMGVMTYEMLTGQLPFEADTAWQWATHHMTSPPRSFDNLPSGVLVPDALQKTVLKALSKDPADRQSSAGQFHRELQAGLSSTAAAAVPAVPAGGPVSPLGATQAMPEQAPPGAAIAATEAMPVAQAMGRAGGTAAAPAVAVPPAPASAGGAGGGKGLVYGLAGLGAVLLVAIGVVAVGGGDDDTPATPIELGASAKAAGEPTGTAEVAPETEAEPPKDGTEPGGENEPASHVAKTDPPPPKAAPKPAPKPTRKPTPASQPKPAPSQPAPTPAPQPATPPPIPAPTTPPPVASTPKPTADGCAACLTAVDRKDILGAANAFRSCGDRRAQAKCRGKAIQEAPDAARFAALNGDCTRAKAIMTAATSMGVPAGRFKETKKHCP